MTRSNSFINLVLLHLFVQLLLTLISSIDWIYLLISLIIYLILIIKENDNVDQYSSHYVSSLIFSIFHYFVFTLSYAEILPWETGLVIFFIILIVYYTRKLSQLTHTSYLKCLPFGKCKEEFDPSLNVLIIKYLLVNICLFVYTFNLCLTTICTPEMYFNWFLIIKNCEYTYGHFHSSYTLSGGILVSFSWTIISLYYLFIYRFR